MKIFITGASGLIGSAVTKELLAHGHQVLGLARSDASAEKIVKAGGEAHKGDIEDLEALRSGVKASDGVIHLAFGIDFNNIDKMSAIDRAAITAMAEAMAGTGNPLVIASGTLLMEKGKTATEDDKPERGTPFAARGLSEDLVFELSKEKGIRGSAIRLSPTVHSSEDKHGMMFFFESIAKKNGLVTMVGDGSNVWPAVHQLDAARLFRLAAEKGKAGSVYHACAELVPSKEFLTVMSKKLGLPLESKTLEDAAASMGPLAYAVGADNPVSTEKTKKELDWNPTHPGLISDLEAHYFS